MSRRIIPGKAIEPYADGPDDMEFLRKLGIDPEDAQKVADALGIPLNEQTETYDDATGLPEDES